MYNKSRITYEGKPLEVLNALLKKRSEILGETTKNAVVATMLSALVSIRAATKNAKKTSRFNIEVEDTGWYGGFSYSEHKPVIRSGVSPYAMKVEGLKKVVWLTHNITQQSEKHVYKVTPSAKNISPYYIVARSPQIALNYELRATKHRIDKHGALAKNALTIALAKAGQAGNDLEGSGESKAKASEVAKVEVHETANTYSMVVSDELLYATDAMKGGENALQLALMRAANKIAGRLQKAAEKTLDDEIGIPFPEVQQRRKS